MKEYAKLETPCSGCGYGYAYLFLDLSDPDAEELPIVSRCARCKKQLARTCPATDAQRAVPVPDTEERPNG